MSKKAFSVFSLLCLLLTTFATALPAYAQEEEPVEVRVAATPFFDYQFFSVADEFGWDEELGLDLQFTWLTQSGPSIQALAAGSVDTVNTCVVCNFPFYESVPEMMDFLTVNQFKGFVVIDRVGLAKPYSEFLEELEDPEEAKLATIEQFRGATWPMRRPMPGFASGSQSTR